MIKQAARNLETPASQKRSKPQDARVENRQRLTPELVFAFVEPYCGGTDEVMRLLENKLSSPEYGYQVNKVIISDIIQNLCKDMVKPELDRRLQSLPNLSSYAAQTNELQQMGNNLREQFGRDILIRYAMKEIAKPRAMSCEDKRHQAPVRCAHFVKSLKNEEEYRLLQEVYGPILFLIGVSDSEKRRLDLYVRKSGATQRDKGENEFNIITQIDQNDDNPHGQQVGKLFHKSDLFLSADGNLEQSITRFLDLLFGKAITSPTLDEINMKESFTASMRSCCLSRQVGAAITDPSGRLISTGWNDIPAVGGGLVMDRDGDPQNLLCKSRGRCNSNGYLKELLSQLIKGLEDNYQLKMDAVRSDLAGNPAKLLKQLGLNGIKEFSRSVHAEMEAIISCARGGYSTQGATMYVTTYPCENCVKHIIDAGIKRVVFIEPYPKSMAWDFYRDQICDRAADVSHESKVFFEQFSGIAPKAFTRLFGMAGERKNNATGELLASENPLMPVTRAYMDGFPLYEANIIKGLEAGKDE